MKKCVFTIMAVAALTSCSQTDVLDNGNGMDDAQAIALKSSIVTMDVATRAPFYGKLSEDNAFTPMVIASSAKGNYSAPIAEGTMTFVGSDDGVAFNTGFTGSNIFPGTAAIYLSGLYPTDFSVTSGVATLTLTGKEDVMYAPEVSTTKADVQDLKFASLDFTHELTKMELRFRADGPTAIDKFGYIKNVVLSAANGSAVNTAASVTLSSSSVVEIKNATTSSTFGCYGLTVTKDEEEKDVFTYSDDLYEANHKLSTTNTYLAYTLAPSVTASNTVSTNEYTFTITYNDGKEGSLDQTKAVMVDLKDVDGNLFNASTKGYSFLISFAFSANEINATATVQDWYKGGESKVVIE